MKERTPHRVMTELNPQRRRSPRLSSPQQAPLKGENKMAETSATVKRSITVRKIAPRKTAALSEHNKENTPRRSADLQQKKPKVSTPDPVPESRAPSSKKKKKGAMPSPILPPSQHQPPQQPAADPKDAAWSQKVRRSYSRLSDRSVCSPHPSDFLFGFEMLQTPEVVRRVEQQPGPPLEVSGSGLGSFTSLLEAEDCGPEPDQNIPGVVVVKERKKRRRKVPQIQSSEMEQLAAQMNAEFEEAEEFELVVE